MFLTIPNLFTMVRIFMTPFVLSELAHGHFISGGWLFGGAAITDLLDGAVARRFGGETKLGLYLDPVADKILLSCIYIGLAAGRAVPWWLVVVIFGRDLWILALSAIALRFTTFRQLEPSEWGKASTFLQIITAVAIMAAEGYHDMVLRQLCGFLILLVAVFALISAGEYSRRGIVWLKTEREARRRPGGSPAASG